MKRRRKNNREIKIQIYSFVIQQFCSVRLRPKGTASTTSENFILNTTRRESEWERYNELKAAPWKTPRTTWTNEWERKKNNNKIYINVVYEFVTQLNSSLNLTPKRWLWSEFYIHFKSPTRDEQSSSRLCGEEKKVDY